jgi:hypothetical protein
MLTPTETARSSAPRVHQLTQPAASGEWKIQALKSLREPLEKPSLVNDKFARTLIHLRLRFVLRR